MGRIKWRGGALIAPLPPIMVSLGDNEKSNIITVAWTGILNTVPPKTYISVRPSRYSHDIIKERGEFAINLTTTELIRAADYCGMFTGRKVDKFEKCNLTKGEASEISCPLIDESPLSLECKVCDIVPLGTHDMFIADIVGVSVDEKLLDGAGKLHLERAHLAAFAHGEYYELGKKIGYFGFSAKKKSGKNRPPKTSAKPSSKSSSKPSAKTAPKISAKTSGGTAGKKPQKNFRKSLDKNKSK